MTSKREPILSVENLCTYFSTEDGTVKAVDGISFDLLRGETLGIVGESGSGKSVTNLSIIRLIPSPPGRIVAGEVIFDGQDMLALPPDEVRKIRGKRIAMIFQDPMTSLNPFMRISRQLMELTQLHLGHTKARLTSTPSRCSKLSAFQMRVRASIPTRMNFPVGCGNA
jgi:oligopeptide transport system ATP-binding protein